MNPSLFEAVRRAAESSQDLLHRQYRAEAGEERHPLTGHCYIACESLFHSGYREKGFFPHVIKHEGSSHWFLKNPETQEVVDPTAEQFSTPVPYESGRRCGFLTRDPSKRARVLMERMQPGLSPEVATPSPSRTRK